MKQQEQLRPQRSLWQLTQVCNIAVLTQVEYDTVHVVTRADFSSPELPDDGFYCITADGVLFPVNAEFVARDYLDTIPHPLGQYSFAPIPQTWPPFEYLAGQAMQ